MSNSNSHHQNDQPKRFRFMNKTIAALPANYASNKSTDAEYTDTEVTGLKCLVSKSQSSGSPAKKKWLLRYLLNSRKRSISLGHFPSVDVTEARKLANEYKRQLANGIDPKQARDNKRQELTLSELFWDKYLPNMQHKRSLRNDKQRFRDSIQPSLGHLLVSELQVNQLQQLQKRLQAKYKPATNNRVFALLKSIYSWANRMGYYQGENPPPKRIRLLAEDNQRTRVLTKDEMRLFISGAEVESDTNYYAAKCLQLLLILGLRSQELATAQWQHLNLQQRHLFIPNTKNGHARYCLLNDTAINIFNNIPAIPTNPYIFPGQKQGKPINNLRKPMMRILSRMRIDPSGLSPHSLRASLASLIVAEGGTVHDVAGQLGHRSLASSMRYIVQHDERVRLTSDKMGLLLDGAFGAKADVTIGDSVQGYLLA
jgi:integrase